MNKSNCIGFGMLLTACLLAGLRFWIGFTTEPQPASFAGSYEAISHIYMGALLAIMLGDGPVYAKVLFWAMCAVEIFAAIYFRVI